MRLGQQGPRPSCRFDRSPAHAPPVARRRGPPARPGHAGSTDPTRSTRLLRSAEQTRAADFSPRGLKSAARFRWHVNGGSAWASCVGPLIRQSQKTHSAGIRLLPFHRRRPVLTAVLLVACAGAVIDRRAQDDYSRYHDRVFTVAAVVDGDTIDIAIADRGSPTTRIRLWGVDTPEIGGTSEPSMYYGPEASAYTEAMLDGGKVRLLLSPTKTRGLYGRLLAYVYVESTGQMLNEELVATGHAYADWRFPHPFKRRFKELETKARRQGLGLWSSVIPDLLPPWRRRMEAELGLTATNQD